MVQFINAGQSKGAEALGARLQAELAKGNKVLWLVSGGSNILTTIMAMQLLPHGLTSQLTIIPMDERYGPVGHPDSNTQQLMDAGFNPAQATFLPVLTGASFERTVSDFAAKMTELLFESDVIIGQFGVGPDGHTAGILPGSEAASKEERIVVGYRAADFQRITVAYTAIRRFTAGYAFIYGANKLPALKNILAHQGTLIDTPSLILRSLDEMYIYNDQLKEDVAV